MLAEAYPDSVTLHIASAKDADLLLRLESAYSARHLTSTDCPRTPPHAPAYGVTR